MSTKKMPREGGVHFAQGSWCRSEKVCCWIHTVGWSYKVLCGSSWNCKEHTDKIMLSLRLNHFHPGSCVKNLLNFCFTLLHKSWGSFSSSYVFLNMKNLPHDILFTVYFKSVSFLYSTISIQKIFQSISSKKFITKTNDPGRDEQSYFACVHTLHVFRCVYTYTHTQTSSYVKQNTETSTD